MTQKAVEKKNQPSPTSSAETKRLDVFIGKWNAERKLRRCK